MKKSWVISAMLIAATAGVAARAADDLSMARELYASAAYEEALATLNRVRSVGAAPADVFAVEQYRAFCLLALGRSTEAQVAIESLVTADPLYQPSQDVSPRVRAAFTAVRRRLLPSIVPQQYAKAKAAFDRKDYMTAADGFGQVLADPDLATLAGQPPLSDLKTLAVGFQELSAKAIPPPPLAATPPPAPVVTAEPAPTVPTAPRIYTIADTKVMIPAVIRQDLPPFTGRVFQPVQAALEVVIDEAGFVERATMLEPVNRTYDRLILESTKNWRYKPATLEGLPVKFRKVIAITVQPKP